MYMNVRHRLRDLRPAALTSGGRFQPREDLLPSRHVSRFSLVAAFRLGVFLAGHRDDLFLAIVSSSPGLLDQLRHRRFELRPQLLSHREAMLATVAS